MATVEVFDHETALRKAVIARLKADSRIAAIVGARIYDNPPAMPQWPYIRYGVPIVTPLRASGWRVEEFRLTIHAFVNGPNKNEASTLSRLIRMSLDEQEVTIETSAGLASLQWTSAQILSDDSVSADAYHAVVEFEAAIAEVAD